MRILDTDIGTDVDDLLALVTLWGGESRLDAITTVYGDTGLRAQIVLDAYRRAGLVPPPVIAGTEVPRSGRRVFWAGHEGAALTLDPALAISPDPGAAAAALRTADEILAIGPLTNLALALALDSDAGASRRIVMMAGDFAGAPEHNIICDVDAAAAVFDSGAPIEVIGTEQTQRVRLDRELLGQLPPTALGELLAGEITRFRRFMSDTGNTPHDAIAVLLAEHPERFTLERGRVSVDDTAAGEGRVHVVADPGGPHRVVRGFDAAWAEAEISRRILAAAAL